MSDMGSGGGEEVRAIMGRGPSIANCRGQSLSIARRRRAAVGIRTDAVANRDSGPYRSRSGFLQLARALLARPTLHTHVAACRDTSCVEIPDAAQESPLSTAQDEGHTTIAHSSRGGAAKPGVSRGVSMPHPGDRPVTECDRGGIRAPASTGCGGTSGHRCGQASASTRTHVPHRDVSSAASCPAPSRHGDSRRAA